MYIHVIIYTQTCIYHHHIYHYMYIQVYIYIYTVRMLLPQLALDSGGILDRRSSVGWACRGFGAILSAYLGGYKQGERTHAMVAAARTVRARI